MGDLGDGELLDAMQMLDALEGGVIDHLVLAICCSTSLRRRGAGATVLRGGGGRVVEREDLIQRGLEGDEAGVDEG